MSPRFATLNKLLIYIQYFIEYIKYRDLDSIIASLRFVTAGSVPDKDRIVKSRLGRFKCRAGTIDFQYVNYVHEKRVKVFIEEYVKDYTHFIDVGSCMGEYCVWLTNLNMQCIAFEPVEINSVNLEENLKLNNIEKKVMVKKIGLGDKKESVYFNIEDTRTGASGIDKSYLGLEKNVKIDTFDNLINHLPVSIHDNVIMKFDIEGMEIEALKGAKEFISGTKNIIIILEHPFVGKENIVNTLDMMGDFSYKILDSANIAAIKIISQRE